MAATVRSDRIVALSGCTKEIQKPRNASDRKDPSTSGFPKKRLTFAGPNPTI